VEELYSWSGSWPTGAVCKSFNACFSVRAMAGQLHLHVGQGTPPALRDLGVESKMGYGRVGLALPRASRTAA